MLCDLLSPRYNRTGWPGVKHQFIYWRFADLLFAQDHSLWLVGPWISTNCSQKESVPYFLFVFCWPIIFADLRGIVFFADLSSVLTSEALCFLLTYHLCWPQRHCSHATQPLATPVDHSALQPHTLRSTGGDVRSLVGYHPEETLHCCRVTSVIFSSTCSHLTCSGHHTHYTPYWWQCYRTPRIRLSVCVCVCGGGGIWNKNDC